MEKCCQCPYLKVSTSKIELNSNQLEKLECAKAAYLSLPFLSFPYISLPFLTFPYLSLPFLTFTYLSFPFLTLPYLTLPLLTFFGCKSSPISRNVRSSVSPSVSQLVSQLVRKCKIRPSKVKYLGPRMKVKNGKER